MLIGNATQFIITMYSIDLKYWDTWTLVLLNPDMPFANSVDPDQLATSEANWSGSALFAI